LPAHDVCIAELRRVSPDAPGQVQHFFPVKSFSLRIPLSKTLNGAYYSLSKQYGQPKIGNCFIF
jgi:hypothetical protein